MHWRLNRIQYPLYNLGPGDRIGIWVQGCSIKCQGCISPSLWPTDKGRDIKIESLLTQILGSKDYFDGITITGGEPFDQYEALVSFCAFIKQKTQLDIYVFSGYSLKELESKFTDKLFAKFIDYLMAGRYIQKEHEDKNTRGSSNQVLYEFKNGCSIISKKSFQSNHWSIDVSDSNHVFMSGIPKKTDLAAIKESMKNAGIEMEFT
jgi:anaerobic ribonucleoside-triphosphate reductase activating protein